jgi:hypothetical protein
MQIIETAEKYCDTRGIARTPVYAAKRFAAVIGDIDLSHVTQSHVDQYTQSSRQSSVPAWTIAGTLAAMRTLCKASNGPSLRYDIRKPHPEPHPAAIEDLSAIWQHLAGWSRQWMAIQFWTCLRLTDAIAFQRAAELGGSVWRYRASKTQQPHVYPVPEWMPQWCGEMRLPYGQNDDWSQVLVRAELDRCCKLARIKRILPQQVRQAGLTAWAGANATACQIIHGCGIGVLSHYLDPLSVLESAAPRVRIPSAMRGDHQTDDTESALLSHFRRLDPAAQGIISLTAERLAAG